MLLRFFQDNSKQWKVKIKKYKDCLLMHKSMGDGSLEKIKILFLPVLFLELKLMIIVKG